MSRTATVRARIDPDLKAEVVELLNTLGVSTTDAITMFFSQIKLQQGLPFPVKIPSETTRRTFEATDNGRELHSYESLDDLFESLDKC